MSDDDEPTVVKIDNGYLVVSKKTARMIEEVNTERRQHGEYTRSAITEIQGKAR